MNPKQDRETEAKKPEMLYGMSLGATAANGDTDEDDEGPGFGVRIVEQGSRVSAPIVLCFFYPPYYLPIAFLYS